MGSSDSEQLTQEVCDRQTDGQTDIPPLAIPAVCIARYANALVKTYGCFCLDCMH